MPPRYLVVHTEADQQRIDSGLEFKLLREAGAEVRGRGRCTTEDEIIELAKDADAVLNGLAPITRKVLTNIPKCKVVARYGVGYDNVDLQAATEQGIAIAYVPDYCFEEVSNSAIVFILALAKQLIPFDSSMRKGEWNVSYMTQTRSVHGETLGIVGAGRIGMATARKAQAFSMNIVACDPFVKPALLQAEGITPLSLDELLARSDYVSVHTPLMPQTRHLIGREQLGLMKKTACLINTSRGPVVDEAALVEALREGRIAGAGLDVFEREPLPADSPLRSMANVVMTPHMGAQSPIAMQRLRQRIAEEVIRALRGEFPLNVANPAVRKTARLFARS